VLDCNRCEWSDGGDGRGGARDFVGRDLESVLDRGVYENLTRGDFSTIRLVKDCYFDAQSAQPDQRKSSRVSGPMIFFGPSQSSRKIQQMTRKTGLVKIFVFRLVGD
jgi:hypothetical protein